MARLLLAPAYTGIAPARYAALLIPSMCRSTGAWVRVGAVLAGPRSAGDDRASPSSVGGLVYGA
jgi:hypothetical protein